MLIVALSCLFGCIVVGSFACVLCLWVCVFVLIVCMFACLVAAIGFGWLVGLPVVRLFGCLVSWLIGVVACGVFSLCCLF